MMKKVSPIAPWENIFTEPLNFYIFHLYRHADHQHFFAAIGIHKILKLQHLSDDALALFVGVLLQYICNLDQGLLRQPLECRHLEKSDSMI